MVRKTWLGIVAASGLVASAGCHESTAPSPTLALEVTKLEAPSVIAPGASLTVVLTVGTGCGLAFNRVLETRSPTEVILTAVGRTSIPPIGCIDVLKLEKLSYEIKAPLPSRFTVVVREPGTLAPLTADVLTGFTID
jgi:hypothetical protein